MRSCICPLLCWRDLFASRILSGRCIPLKEEGAYPAAPQHAYGWEKLVTERLCRDYRKDYHLETCTVRFQPISGQSGYVGLLKPLSSDAGGESGIRTHDTVSRIHAFQACAFSHSAISPAPVVEKRATEPGSAAPFQFSGPILWPHAIYSKRGRADGRTSPSAANPLWQSRVRPRRKSLRQPHRRRPSEQRYGICIQPCRGAVGDGLWLLAMERSRLGAEN